MAVRSPETRLAVSFSKILGSFEDVTLFPKYICEACLTAKVTFGIVKLQEDSIWWR